MAEAQTLAQQAKALMGKDPRKSGDAQEQTQSAPSTRRKVLVDKHMPPGGLHAQEPSGLEQVQRTHSEDDDMVDVTVGKPFKLTCDDGVTAHYTQATKEMPRTHAEHWFAKAHKVEIVE